MITFVKWKDANNEFRWTLWSQSRKIACSGEGYKNLGDLDHEIEVIRSNASTARIQDRTDE